MSEATRLYYADSYLTEFTARVAGWTEHRGRPAVILNQTAFYPTSGGQPHDTGRLNGVAVVAVEENECGDVLHLTERRFDQQAVQGQVDWPRRHDHMQQHTGQHILSQAFWQLLQAETVGFHLAESYATIDVNVPHLDLAAVEEVEALANRIVYEDRPVQVRWVSPAALDTVPLRKPPAVSGEVRVVQVERFDWSACGGTHVRRSGEVGAVAITRVEHRGADSRIHFLCGARAAADHRGRVRLTNSLMASLTVGLDELPAAVERLQEEVRAARRDARALQDELLAYRAEALLAQAATAGPWRVVRHILPEGQSAAAKWLAQRLTEGPSVVALLGTAGERSQMVFACSEDVTAHMGTLLREVTSALGGKGGGNPRLAQGGGLPSDRLEAALEAARSRLQEKNAP
ncbi:MAG: alanyl-tRNA editing protein [Chloroflexi bacterium]|nr:alanyl-tRNA editing protein [Chloroflexota bacterium]